MKHVNFAVSLFFIFCTLKTQAQAFILNYVPFEGSSTLNLYSCINPVSGGHFIASGTVREAGSSTSSDMMVTLFDQNGAAVWNKKHGYPSTVEATTYATELNGNYYIIGWTDNGGVNNNELLIMALDASGNMLANWPKKYQASLSSTTKYAYKIIQVGNHLVISGSASSHSFDNLLFAIDFNGNIVWDYTYSVDNDKGGYDLLQLSNGNLGTVGYIYDGTYDMQLMITDTVGSLLSLYRYDYPSNDVNATQLIDLGQSAGLIAIGNINSGINRDIFVAKLNYSGVVQWSKKYGLSNQDDIAQDAHLLNDGTICIVGNTQNPNSSNNSRCALVLRIDVNGNIVSQGAYQPTNTSNENYRFLSFTESPAGTLRIVGDGVSPSTSEDGLIVAAVPVTGLSATCGYLTTSLVSNAVTIVKSNPAVDTYAGFGIGTVSETVSSETLVKSNFCGSLTGIENASGKEAIKALVYPNPAQEYVIIQLENADEEDEFRLAVYDGLGQAVFAATYTGSEYRINTNEWANGLYTFTVIKNSAAYMSGKFTVLNR